MAGHAERLGVPRETRMAKALYAVDELSGFIAACALVRPTGVQGMTPKSVKKKLKQPSFAAAVDREEVRRGAEDLGEDFDEHLRIVIGAMEERPAELGLEGPAPKRVSRAWPTRCASPSSRAMRPARSCSNRRFVSSTPRSPASRASSSASTCRWSTAASHSNEVVTEAAAAMRESRLGIKAATVTPEGTDDVGSPNRILREELDGRVIIRTGRRIPGITPVAGVTTPSPSCGWRWGRLWRRAGPRGG